MSLLLLLISPTSAGGPAPTVQAVIHNLTRASASGVAMVAGAQDHRPGGTASTSAPGATAKHIDP